MSNRLTDAGRLPLVLEPLLAAQAGSVFSETQALSIQVSELGRAFFELPGMFWNLVRQVTESIETAMRLRNLAGMSDHMLSDMGIRRDQLPQLFLAGRLSAFGDSIAPSRKGNVAV